MLLTFKIKHNGDITSELNKAKLIAKHALTTRTLSSKDVKHIGLKSVIACQILRRYSSDLKCITARNPPLIIPGQATKVDRLAHIIWLPCLKLGLPYRFRDDFTKINQVELNKNFAFITVTIEDAPSFTPLSWLGVDLNTTGHTAVVCNPDTGKTIKMGKIIGHTRNKYKHLKSNMQKIENYRLVKTLNQRERNIVRNINHKISREIVNIAKEGACGIRLENLKNIRENKRVNKSFRGSLSSWSFNQIQVMIDYKAKLLGIPVEYIDPRYTSQLCSRCGLIGNRHGKSFKCTNCNHVDNADVNAAFNIAKRQPGLYQSVTDRVVAEGHTDIPKEDIHGMRATSKPRTKKQVYREGVI
jgi:putative transposase